ncbi:MAG: hypothetical protein H0X16_05980 [Chloroflexi bacterium]|nr:hypothetical protein [Chloroflexota bacterium]
MDEPSGNRWSIAELDQELQRFHQDLQAAKLEPVAIFTYVDRARRFLRWRAQASSEQTTAPQSSSPDDLAIDLKRYQTSLEDLGRKRLTVISYIDGASRFLRWLVGDYEPGARRTNLARSTELAPTALGLGKHEVDPDSAVGAEHKADWQWEGNVVAALARSLQEGGWRIEHIADTERRERGIDLLASRDGAELAVEVKGYPSKTYVRGPKAGKRKRAHPSLLAVNYLSGAIFTVLAMQAARRSSSIAIGLPDVPRYRDLLVERRPAFAAIGIGVLLVAEDGMVEELLAPRPSLATGSDLVAPDDARKPGGPET